MEVKSSVNESTQKSVVQSKISNIEKFSLVVLSGRRWFTQFTQYVCHVTMGQGQLDAQDI